MPTPTWLVATALGLCRSGLLLLMLLLLLQLLTLTLQTNAGGVRGGVLR